MAELQADNSFAVHVVGKGVMPLTVTAGQRDEAALLAAGTVVIVELDRLIDNGVINQNSDVLEDAVPARLVRRATDADLEVIAANQQAAQNALQQLAQNMRMAGIAFKAIDASFNFSRETLSILFGSETQVDFNDMRTHIPAEIKANIDFRRVGIRDECAFIGGIGPCGRAFCCCDWQKYFNPINIRMAKAQEMPLTPSTLNGACDKLKCCLSFEYEQYLEAAEGLPTYGMIVEGEGIRGKVIGRDVMQGLLTIQTSDYNLVRMPYAQLKVVRGRL